ncbi:MAG TPA: indole-3-glycerol-phosphate synthase, partial [Acidimicrobiia bacterium]|nr:indole-3-glycerol-phosphate synthase [Acidimicrobiia bacterium]
MSDFLSAMAEESSRRARHVREETSRSGLETRLREAAPPMPLDVNDPGFDVIAEAKLSSPSEGRLVSGRSGAGAVLDLARSYAGGGAAAISVLTEESRFEGALAHLETVSAEIRVPVMRKDFLVDPIQVLEARAAGASGVLLIARMLPRELLVEMTELALAHHMFVLVELFDRADIEIAAGVFDRDVMVGVNCRDLATLEVDTARFETLAPHLPDHLPLVAESGLATAD